MPWLKTGELITHTQLRLSDEGRAIKELVLCGTERLAEYPATPH